MCIAAMLFLATPETPLAWPAFYALLGLQEVLLMGLPAYLLYQRTEESRERLRRSLSLPDSLSAGLTSMAAICYTLASLLVISVWFTLLQSLGVQVPSQVDTIVPQGGAQLAAALFAAALLPAVCEELLFRGILFDWIERRWGARQAVLITSLAFSALHLTLLGFASLMMIGLFLATLRRKYGGILLPMLFHALYNAAVLALNTLNANPSPQTVMLCAGVFIAVSYLLFRKERKA